MNTFFERRYVIAGIFIALAVTLLARLFYIQIVDDKYALLALKNAQRKYVVYPARGPILDRNGKILVQNTPVYDLMVTPRELGDDFDTLNFCKMLGIDTAEFNKRINKAWKYSPTSPSVFEKQMPYDVYSTLSERLSEFNGFFTQERSIRTYPDSTAAQFLGYIGEATDRDIKRSGGYYRQGDYIGITGVERAYESVLRGQRGVKFVYVNSHNQQQGSFAEGMFDTVATPGKRLISSLDTRIQKLGEKLMKDKVGSIVAIEPSTGEILCFVSSPTYDPNLLVGRERGNNVKQLYDNGYNPLLIRPIQAYYPPGSSFKPLAALIALQEGLITPSTSFDCVAAYHAGNHIVHCDEVHGITNLTHGIAMSCNTYFCSVFEKTLNANGVSNIENTYTDWRSKVLKFGFGVKLGVDMPNEKKGFIPTALYYDNHFHANHWRSSTIISLGFGQGELLATPLQLANIEATIANHGYYYTPHLIKGVGTEPISKEEFTKKNYVGVDSAYFEPVINGMQQVVENGTAKSSQIPGIVMCGKTGTAQNPHGKHHSLFVAFAPRDHPKIAIAVVVENSGQGAWWAAPIASMIVEKYLKDSVTVRPYGHDQTWYAEQNLLPALKPKPVVPGKPLDQPKIDTGKSQHVDTVITVKQVQAKPRKHTNKKDSSAKYLAAQYFIKPEDE